MEYYSVIEKNESMEFAGKLMELENIMLSEINQSQKTKDQIFSLLSEWKYIMGYREVRDERRKFGCVKGNEGKGWGRGKETWWNETNIITLYMCMIT